MQSANAMTDAGEYKVELSDGTEIGFYESGDWKSVDCKYLLLPAGILPRADRRRHCGTISRSRYLQGRLRKRGGYEIAIGNGLELIYSGRRNIHQRRQILID